MSTFIKKREHIFIIVIALLITSIFFYKTILFHEIPFPGDLLVNIMPYKMQSFGGFVPGTYPNKAQDIDVITQLYPWKYFAISELKAGRIPFWNPHTFAGNPQMQDYQTGVFYPLNFLFFIFPFVIAWTIYIISQPFLAIIFMYFFLREEKIGIFGSLIGSISFAFSSYMVVWMEYGNIGSTWLWLPLILFFIKKYITTSQLKWFICLILAISTAFLAGYIQGMFYIYIVCALYSGFLLYTHKIHFKTKQFGLLLFGLVLPVLLVSIQLVPTLDVFRASTRGNYSFSQIQFLLNPWYSIATLFAPDFFGNPVNRNMTTQLTYFERVMYPGITILFFACIGLFSSKKKEKWLWGIIGVLGLLFTSDVIGIAHLYQLPIPILSTTVPTRALSVVLFCISMLVAYGVETWEKETFKKYWKVPLLFFCIFGLLWIAVFSFPTFFPLTKNILLVAKRNLLVPTVFLLVTVIIFFAKRFFSKLATIAYIIIVLLDLFYFFQKFTPFNPAEFVYPQTPVISFLQQHEGLYRFWGYGSAEVSPGMQSVDGTYMPNGVDALHLQNYGNLLAASKNGIIPDDVPRMEADVVKGYGYEDLKKNMYRQKLLNTVGAKYILHKNDVSTAPDTLTFSPDIYRLLWQKNGLQLYDNMQSLPRTFLVSKYEVIPNETEAIKHFYGISFHPADTVLLSEMPKQKLSPNAQGKVSIMSYAPQKVHVQTQTTGTMLLFLSDTYSPDWHVMIDGKLTHMYLADTAFRSVIIPKGNHQVTFFYESESFIIGLRLSLLGIIGLVVICVYLYRYEKK